VLPDHSRKVAVDLIESCLGCRYASTAILAYDVVQLKVLPDRWWDVSYILALSLPVFDLVFKSLLALLGVLGENGLEWRLL